METPDKSEPFGQPGAASGAQTLAGEVSWLACGAQPLAASLEQIRRLVASFGGELATLESEPRFSVVRAALRAECVAAFKGALALAGASFAAPGPGSRGEGVLIFILADASAETAPATTTHNPCRE